MPLGENQQVVGKIDGGTPLPFRSVERKRQRFATIKPPVLPDTMAEKLLAHSPSLPKGRIVRHHLATGEVKELSVGRKRAKILIRLGGDVRHRMRVERHRMVEDVVIENGFPQNQLSFLDLVGIFRIGEQIWIIHNDARELHRFRILLVEISDTSGIKIAIRFEIGAHLEDAVERRQRLRHIGLVTPFGHELVILQGEVIP